MYKKKEEEEEDIQISDEEGLHPSLDIKDDILTLGFRYRAKSGKEENLSLVVYGGNAQLTKQDNLKMGNKNYFIDRRARRLVHLQERWNWNELKQFLADYNDLKLGAVPEVHALFDELKDAVKRYVELEKEIDYSITVAWIVGTYFHPAFSAYSFLNIKALKHSGKSQFLGLLRQLCFNAVKAQPTLGALGDTVDALRGTYLIDQADSLRRKGTEELLGLLTDSYKRGGGKRRIIIFGKDGSRNTAEYSAYGPKALASIKDLPDDLQDRCFIVPLMRSKKNFPDPDEEGGPLASLRGKIYKFLIANYQDVAGDYLVGKIRYKQSTEIVGRHLELWLPLETILRSMEATEAIVEAKERFLSRYKFAEAEPSELEMEVLKMINEKFKDGETEIAIFPKELANSIEVDLFPSKTTGHQRAVKIGWTINNLNIAREKGRSSDGVYYLIRKDKAMEVSATYFPTPPTQDVANPEKKEGLGSVDAVAGA